MFKRTILVVSFLAIIAFLSGAKASAQNVTNINTAETFPTIQAAIDDADTVNGHTIRANPGTYAELVTVNKSLIIEGAKHDVDARRTAIRTGLPAVESVVTGNAGTTAFYVTVNNVTIDGFTVQGNTNVNQFGGGIFLAPNTSGHTIENNIVQNNIIGIQLGSDSTTIRQNLFQNNNNAGAGSGNAIYSDQFVSGGTLTGITITNNTFTSNNSAGVSLSASAAGTQSGITISENIMTGNGNAVFAGFVTTLSITKNTITASIGSQIAFGGGVSGVTISENFIDNGSTNGIRVLDVFGGAPANTGVTANCNSISGNPTAGINITTGTYTGVFDAKRNWWGSATGPNTPKNPGGTGDKIIDPDNVVQFSPFITSGTDTQPATKGFQCDQTQLGFAAQAASWTTTGDSSVTEDESNPARPTYTNFTAAANAGSPIGSYVLRYNIQATSSLTTPGATNTRLRVRFRDDCDICTRVTVAIIRSGISGGLSQIGPLFDSDAYAPSNGFQTQEITFPAVTFDFTQNSYWLEVTLTKPITESQPAFGSAQITQQ